ncbi:glutactin [Anastrepha ludens]|uniref:glutactin n=1 Tax=Anastrepha ludens TaxID=28586 RepID=UPI0023B16FD2|nr:glutactin [Anastrepha ludens]
MLPRGKRISPLLCVTFILVLSLSLCNTQWPYDDYDIEGGEVETEHDVQSGHLAQNVPAGSIIESIPRPGSPPEHPDELIVPGLGVVRGKIGYKRIKGRPINSYLGLKYGVVRPGLGRFQQANVYKHYRNEPIDATQVAPNCPQFPDLKLITAAEARHENVDDCLSLNIHVPSFVLRTQQRMRLLPVMVFVHGEMLFDGSAEEAQPDYFMEQDVVLVSINYRLAPFGFLTTLSKEMPGNVALADIQLALEWIQQYIRAFGGDPLQVTLFGQAGGATLVHALSLSNKAQGLFHKLILQSGTALNPFFLEQDALSTARSFARSARCPRTSTLEVQNLHSCFERLSTTELLETMKRHYEENEIRGLHFMGGFKLAVGDSLEYLPVHPAALVANRTVPMIIGVAKDAGSFILTSFYDELTRLRSNNISDYINVVLRHTTQPRHYLIWKNLALREIFNEQDTRNPTLPTLIQGLLELTNLILYRGPVLDTIKATYKKTPTYLYCFDYRGEFHRFGHLKSPLPFETDATLSDDNIYLFPYPEEVSNLIPQDRALSQALVNMWADFAAYGVPIRNNVVWPNVTTEVGPFLRIVNSKATAMELDYHFADGIPVPNVYPEYFSNTTIANATTTTTTTTTTPRPRLNYPHYSNHYPNYNPNYRQNYQHPDNYQYRPRTTILNGAEHA